MQRAERENIKNSFSLQLDHHAFELATEEEKLQQEVMGESTTFFKDGMRKLMRNPLAVFSLAVLSIILLTIIVAPHVVPYKYSEIISVDGKRDRGAKNLKPFEYSELEQEYIDNGGEVFPHIFGTDALSRDYFIRVVYGTRVSLSVGLFASLIVLVIGLLYGSISGYVGGRADLIMMRIVDIIYSLPDMLIIILLSVVLDQVLQSAGGGIVDRLGSNMISIFLVFGLLYWVGMARLVRGQILSIKKNEYVLAAKTSGAKASRIIRKHILPNSISVIIISTALQIPSAIFTESFLSFVGLGVQAPMPSLGSLANAAREGLQSYPYKLLFPATIICLIVLSLNLLGDGMRDAFDPKLRK
ncbi:ABC transporter permease [Proteiniclasticum ruminis]|uniref:Oligopeptide transport system permease protein n=1 Tax=Proteiniclasticum ruminis TaxID=398199 RepID=A0A1I5DF12_9CLOT|nr:ABC transporter permease [Proteiniclasticum ruminis]SFN97772.1 oligopeptide transport system permease protein [Proteiniclasticum ruminis]